MTSVMSRVGPALSRLVIALVIALVITLGESACGVPKGAETHTFFQNDEDLAVGRVELPFPPLDRPAEATRGAYIGVAVFGGAVRFSRPATWRIRRASTVKEHRYVEYVSPNEYLFAIYARSDDPGTSWTQVLLQYEGDAKTRAVEFVGKDIPTAGYDTQGREYVLKRKIKGQRAPYENTSREFIFRGKHAFALVELVHQGQSDASIEAEVLRVVESFSVL